MSDAPARTREDVDTAVLEIVELMTSGAWVSGSSHADMAKRYGVHTATVKSWATSASRVIRAALATDPEEIRSRYMATLESIAASALQKKSATKDGEIYDSPDHKAAVSAIAESARLAGLVTQKHEIAAPNPEEAAKRWKELTGQDWKPKE